VEQAANFVPSQETRTGRIGNFGAIRKIGKLNANCAKSPGSADEPAGPRICEGSGRMRAPFGRWMRKIRVIAFTNSLIDTDKKIGIPGKVFRV
jgi:hypothetical protein